MGGRPAEWDDSVCLPCVCVCVCVEVQHVYLLGAHLACADQRTKKSSKAHTRKMKIYLFEADFLSNKSYNLFCTAKISS